MDFMLMSILYFHCVLYLLLLYHHQTCDIQMEGGVRKLTLKNCQLDQAGEVSYQALNAMTSAMLNVKGKKLFQDQYSCWFGCIGCKIKV